MWLVLAVLAIIAAGAVAVSRARLIAHTRALLGVSPKLDPSIGRFEASEMALDGPIIGLRTRLDLQETRDG